MAFSVRLTDDAARDLEEIYDYIATHDNPKKAEGWLKHVEQAFAGLNQSPKRGVYPKELAALGIREYRQVYFKPYRVVYRVLGNNVFVVLVSDGRRDMRSLLEQRLFGAE